MHRAPDTFGPLWRAVAGTQVAKPDESSAGTAHAVQSPVYTTALGSAYAAPSEQVLGTPEFVERHGLARLILTSPPFPLNTKKRYGNLQGEEYIAWLTSFAPRFLDSLLPDGSIVVEIGNAWERGRPVMSTTTLRALLSFLSAGGLNLCQEFIWYNPARLPSPVEWVNKQRIRVKDSFTRVWWMSPVDRPKADNRHVLRPYSKSMKKLLRTGRYNSGHRPSQHTISQDAFANDNGGAISPNVLDAEKIPGLGAPVLEPGAIQENLFSVANTRSRDPYRDFCRQHALPIHPARMPVSIAEFFIRFLTDESELILDPFAGSNTTGAAAESLQRRWYSIEANSKYVLGSMGRFKQDSVQQCGSNVERV